MATKTVLDISKWQKVINYQTVAISNQVNGVIIRCGYRAMSSGAITQDPLFEKHINGFLSNNMPVGLYFFSTAITEEEGKKEAEYIVSLAKKYPVSFPLFIDTEFCNTERTGRSDHLSKPARTAAVISFCETVKSAGFTPGIYANDDFFKQNLDYNAVKDYYLWVAKYSSNPPKNVLRYEAWQYTSKGRIFGYEGNVDLSKWYADFEKTTVTASVVETAAPKVESVVRETVSCNALSGGTVLSLKNEPCYNSSKALTASSTKTGTYYVWSSSVVNGRIRITNMKANVGIAGRVTGWIDAPTTKDTVVTGSINEMKQGDKLFLQGVNIYSSSMTKSVSSKRDGTFFVWNAVPVNHRIRITTSKDLVGQAGQVTGWIDLSDAKNSRVSE